MAEIIVFTRVLTPRIKYIADFIFHQVHKTDFLITTDTAVYIAFPGPKINYSLAPLASRELHILPQGLLEKTDILTGDPTLLFAGGLPQLFPDQTGMKSCYGFDLFAAVFYMLSRMEEAGSPARDKYGRYPAIACLASRHNFLHQPVVDLWLIDFFKSLSLLFPGFPPLQRICQVLFTYDIDVAYAHTGRTLHRTLGSFAKNLWRGNLNVLADKALTLTGGARDPFDTYDHILGQSISPLFFFLINQRLTTYDHNILPQSNRLHQLIKKLNAVASIGLHPTYYASEKPHLIGEEKTLLEQMSLQPVRKSRQHYLRFTWPDTYHHLRQAGIQEDYSMAFAEQPGFRAGTCTPFYFFDLANNCSTKLLLYPSCIMDSTFRDDIIMPAADALPVFTGLYDCVKAVGGHFIPIFHNDTLRSFDHDEHPLNFRKLHHDLLHYIRGH